MKRTKVLFFDLDNTLFDHKRAERTALVELMKSHPEIFAETDETQFLSAYDRYNKKLWKEMAEGKISAHELKLQRFALSLSETGCPADMAGELSEGYMERYSQLGFTFPNAYETLTYLKERYRLAILSNGFPEIQERKLRNTKLGAFFRHKLYSADLGVMKPDPQIFYKAMAMAGVRAEEAAYVGDSYEDDIESSKKVGWKTIHFSPTGKFRNNGVADLEITELSELMNIF